MSARGSWAMRWRWYAMAAFSVVGFAAFAAPAGAQQESVQAATAAPSPFTTNIPYVAWRGEEIRAVKCTEDLAPAIEEVNGARRFKSGNSVDVLVESWSGASPGPQLESSTVDQLFWSSDGTPCVRFDMVSSTAGLGRVKLVVSDGDHNPIVKHQFLMIWLTLGNVAIDEVGANDPTGQQPAGSKAAVGDPLGDGNLTAGSANGRVQVQVTGTFPHPLAPGGTFTLPNDWKTIAGALATDANVLDTNPAQRWDIHDDQLPTEGHVAGFCTPAVPVAIDAVDNCKGGAAFSNVFGQGVTASGPFDPARPATLLSDGQLNSGDAPMPATRVDLAIAPNTGAAGDISGAGALVAADKSVVYSRDGNGTTTTPHNLYAPYYDQWIPATNAPGPEASGIDGPAKGNNFTGFLFDGLYHNWDTYSLASAKALTTKCNQTVGDPRTTPAGDQTVAVYTDEHGEAQVAYEPYAGGFYYDSLPVVLNRSGGCDLQGIHTLGTAAITATARYPYQPVDANPVASATAIAKTDSNLFDKSLSYWPTGLGADNNNARIVVAHGNDVDGTPFAGETVCFNIAEQADGFQAYTGQAGPLNAPFTVGGGWAKTKNADICRTLDKNGNAAIEVLNSDPQIINVIVNYVDEGLLRSIDVDFSTPGSSGGTVPPGSAGPLKPTTGVGSTAPTLAQIQQTAPAAARVLSKSVTHKSAKKQSRRISIARVALRQGKRVLIVRVMSTRRTERIKIRVGKHTYRRTVATNHRVRITDVTLPGSGTVKVTLG